MSLYFLLISYFSLVLLELLVLTAKCSSHRENEKKQKQKCSSTLNIERCSASIDEYDLCKLYWQFHT